MAKNLYDLKMVHLQFVNNDGTKLYEDGIDFFEKNGDVFKCDEIVVVGGEIGNIECVNLEEGVVGLGLSFDYDECMSNPYDWTMSSGYRCSWDDIRRATEEEAENYNISSKDCCDAAEAADRAYKERGERRLMGYCC